MILWTEWLLDTRHGADYFRRWHRNKNNSGGLMVHKATHHFDLVNWWIDSHPVEVSAMGDLDFYGRENAEERVRRRAPVERRAEFSPLGPRAGCFLGLGSGLGLVGTASARR